ncbi:hypothetical protein, variant 2 [Verruconis gallopava]|uniref:ubiquitinyl hydrolase 1 n=1 Tax=Verruconis gallopava TaxID=253628 RepID=A0A0D1XFD0_9PEZI|nr:hypothetical protein, variant 2 [Verruconis gallopava]KIW00916.1 hypothetical protein, variant 2 [Verruconis gallopava]
MASNGHIQDLQHSVGQTAPRLISTIKTADRQNRVENERNPFIHPPRGYDEQFDATRRAPLYTPCKHYWTTQRNQTVLPDSGITAPGETYRLACFCQHCFSHVDIQIQHTSQPCPKQDYPLHHFTNFFRDDEHNEWYQARCSGCAAQLRIDYRWPRLRPADIELLTSPEKLQQRLEAAKASDPDRGHTKPAAPIEVLDAMSSYLRDSFDSSDEKKIPKLNRRFVTSFGQDCNSLLASMGFKDIGDFYMLPRPEPEDPWAWSLRKQLEDTQEELWALMRQLKEQDPRLELEKLKGYNGKMEPFDEDAQVLLSTFEYEKSKTTRRAPTLTLEEQSWYAGLGALGDFSDELISFAFDRQMATDSANMPYYYDCLTSIAKKRNSETLDVKLALLASEGYYGKSDIVNAYKYFTLDPRQAAELTDDYIRGVFESRLGSVAKSAEPECREKLRLIGVSRNSQALLDAADNEITDHHSALRFLDSAYNENAQYQDDYIIALAGAKRAENDSNGNQEKVSKAIELIANHRNSEALKAYLATGEATITSDDDQLAAAYRFYGIQDRTAELEIAVLQTQLNLTLEDPNESTERKVQAAQYFSLLEKHHKPAPPPKMEADYSKPIGLINTRNYCYLHSILQFLNAIKIFRDTILNFEEFKQPVETADIDNLGRLAGTYIRKLHVEDGHELVKQLQQLFKSLEQAPGPHVKANESLAAEALKQPPSVIPLDENTTPVAESSKSSDSAGNDSEAVQGDETSSDVTLVGDPILTPDSDADDQQMIESSEETGSENALADKDKKKSNSSDDKASPPNRPPPVPPRPKQDSDKTNTTHSTPLEEQYRQQDAHEVTSKIIQRTIAAIKPTRIDPNGERGDRIRDLFYGVLQQLCTRNTEKRVSFEPDYDPWQMLHLSKKPKDVQEGLDITFGRDQIEIGGGEVTRYTVIKVAPPILQLYLQNRETVKDEKTGNFRSERIAHDMEVNKTINLDRYMEVNNQEILPIREHSWDLRDRLEQIEMSLGLRKVKLKKQGKIGNQVITLDSDEAFTALGSIIKSARSEGENGLIDVRDEEDYDLEKLLEDEAKLDEVSKDEMKKELPEIRKELNALPLGRCDTDAMKYHIFAIFMYSGTGAAGHWWIYIRDFKNNVWRSYNDSHVNVVDENEVFQKRDPKQAGPQMIVYVRDDQKDELIDALHRVKPEGGEWENINVDGDSASKGRAEHTQTAETEIKSLLE